MENWCQTMSDHIRKWSDTLSDHFPEVIFVSAKDTDHTRSYDTKSTCTLVHFTATVSQVSRSSLAGMSRSVFVVATEGDFLILC